MSYSRSEMLYDDGRYYKWSAAADHDNPYYTRGADFTELNRTEGYEVLYFINHMGKKYWRLPAPDIYQKMEKMIRYDVPSDTRSHLKIENWIIQNWSKV